MAALGQANPNNGSSGNEQDVCEVINMADSTSYCNNLPAYPLSLYRSTGQVVNSVPIIAGGFLGANYQIENVYKFDKQSNSWLSLGNLATARTRHSSSVLKGALWVIGGYGIYNHDPLEGGSLNSTELVYPNGTITGYLIAKMKM